MRKEYNPESVSSVPNPQARVVIIQGSWHAEFTDRMIDACRQHLHSAGLSRIEIVRVPGCYEIPLVAKKIAAGGDVAAIIVFGAIVKGDTDHYHLILETVIRELGKVMYDFEVPIINEILPVHSIEDLRVRSEGRGNKGIEAAQAATQMLSLLSNL